MAAAVESLLVKASLSLPQDLLLESAQNRNERSPEYLLLHLLTDLLHVRARYLPDGGEARQRPEAAAVSDDHGLRQQTGRVVLR